MIRSQSETPLIAVSSRNAVDKIGNDDQSENNRGQDDMSMPNDDYARSVLDHDD